MVKIIRLFKSFGYAFRGLFKTFREEQNLQVQSIIGIIIVTLGFIFEIKPLEWCLIISVIFLVILMEMINSAVERIADALKPRIHTYVKELKDIMAATVMLSAILAIVVGLIIFIPYILPFLSS
jgi:undecaprenol kinase